MVEDNGAKQPIDEPPEAYASKTPEAAELDHRAKARWWFITSLFPLIGATFGPVASAFSICALANSWRIVLAPDASESSDGIYVADPGWLYAVNAISLAIAVLANLALIVHMGGRLSFSVAQPVTTVGWFISSFLLIGLVAAAPDHLQLPPDQPRTFTQAYYYACFAAAIYFMLACLMTVTLFGVYKGRFAHEYKLTMAQRTLMIQNVVFLGYVLAAAAVYARVEGWDYESAVYFVVVVLFTIGLGDYKPQTHLGRSLFFPMAIGGILFVGVIVASINTLVVESGSRKVTRRNMEKARQKIIRTLDPKTGKARGTGRHRADPGTATDSGSELERREQEFNLMRRVQANAKFVNASIGVCFALVMFLVIWFIGAVVFWQAQQGPLGGGWTYFASIYFTYTSFLTIGFGDIFPTTNSAKPAFVLWAFIALPTLTTLIGSLGNAINEGVNSITLAIAERLPAKTKSLAKLKETAQAVKKQDEFKPAKPPGFMNEEQGHEDDHFDDKEHADAVKGLANGNGTNPKLNNGDTDERASAAVNYRPYLLMKELRNVIGHLDATPPRTYTYSEWAWFLKLLGEDESESSLHRSPVDVKEGLKQDEDVEDDNAWYGSAGLVDGKVQPWSWLGQQSPLMSMDSEPAWVLTKLLDQLEGEMRSVGEERTKRNG